jgi:uncharacterized protein GlcG (DUF336 family)
MTRNAATDSHTQTFERRSITAEFAMRLIKELTAAATQGKCRLSFAIVDESGVMKASMRMDGASVTSSSVAADKAFTASGGRPTHLWHNVIAADEVLKAGAIHSIPRMVTLGGGYPIVIDGAVVGGLGVSGGHYSDDMAVAQAALNRVGARNEW